ncbi:Phage regulatory protein Rha (Phage_pRha) [Paenibacillus algorifonticola]|uniref:Phage regulatory protein Rha (Phage_pRha) n=1 Tax=Paenibacillus algorifonticola TaxID=684063 RepID=A0A1I1XU54_9BACL|nr:phage regulatory protein/antirepressor Ant [Paenibacillus algorifonticola]SFE10885.1 Phage regulatory protein Rha (Phage_pRha) [Paenibacillus algorifonticola]
MFEITIVNQNGQLLMDSRNVAELTGARHDNLLRDIRGYIKSFDALKSEDVESGKDYVKMATELFNRTHGTVEGVSKHFFIESSYVDGKGEPRPCYLLTRKGCDMVANKMTGDKGVLFTAAYVTKFEDMEKQLMFQLPSTYKEALLQLVEQVEQNEKLQTTNMVLVQQNNELKPKASYYDMVLQNKSLLSVSKIAKDYGLSAMALNKKLYELDVQFKQGDIWLLYAKYQDKGYTQTTTHVIDADNSRVSTKWTQKGRLFIYELLKQKGFLPVIEREVAG